MKSSSFRSSRAFYGAIFWLFGLQYFIVQIIAALSWSAGNGYSVFNNTISSLGNTSCGLYGEAFICSPLHTLMNASLSILGIFTLAGALLIMRQYGTEKRSIAGFLCLAAAGTGTLIVGLFPENTVALLHILGAGLAFGAGNIGLVILGLTLNTVYKPIRLIALISGIIALIALLMFISRTYLGLGIGGMERIVAYSQTVWMILFGVYILFSGSTPDRK